MSNMTQTVDKLDVPDLEQTLQITLKRTVKDTIQIGYLLKKLKEKGEYSNWGNYVREKFNLGESSASRFMALNEKYGSRLYGMEIDSRYEGMTTGVLIEMLNMSPELEEQVTPDMTVKQVREIKRQTREPEPPAPVDIPEAEFQEVEICSYDKNIICRIEEVKKKYFLKGGNITGCAGCCNCCLKKQECPHTCFYAKDEILATSQETKPDEKADCPPDTHQCIRQEWGTTPEQQAEGAKECKKCWVDWKKTQKILNENNTSESDNDSPDSENDMLPVKEDPEKDRWAYVQEQYRLQREFLNPFAIWLIKNHKDWFLTDFAARVTHVEKSEKELKRHFSADGSCSFGFPLKAGDTAYIHFFQDRLEIMQFDEAGTKQLAGISDWFYLCASIQSMWNEVVMEDAQEKLIKEPATADIKTFYEKRAVQYDDDRSKLKELLIKHYGKGHNGGNGIGFVYQCSPRGLKLRNADEITWARFVQLVNELIPKVEAEEPEDEQDEDVEEYTAQYFLDEQKQILDEWLEAGGWPEKMLARQKIIVGALASMVCDLESDEQLEQPELPVMKNMDQREEFVNTFHDWPIWCKNELTEETYYRYNLPDGSAIIVKEYPYTYWEGETTGKVLYLLKPDMKHFKDAETCMTTIKEHLKGVR